LEELFLWRVYGEYILCCYYDPGYMVVEKELWRKRGKDEEVN
jgi:hypothetical protein